MKSWQPSKKDVMTDEVLKKSHRHKDRDYTPDICINCNGVGYVRGELCEVCGGEGVVIGGYWHSK